MAAVKILVIPGSIRSGSLNVRLAAAVTKELALADVEVTRISLEDFPLPIYDADLETKSGVPDAARDLRRMIGIHHGLFIATPEYNASVPPLLKNAIDWISRARERNEAAGSGLRDRVVAIGAASERPCGGLAALQALRQILAQGCGAHVIPQQITLPFADRAFDEMDRLKEARDAEMLRATVRQLIDVTQRMM
jgi:NAD(P)H-dependent FMN reductase